MSISKSVCHLTSVHPRYDTRILLKECVYLTAHFSTVYLLVADSQGSENIQSVRVLDVGASTGRLSRMLNVPRRLFKKAKLLDADIYHLHDPELIPIGLKLKKLGKKVIFDAHEDVPKQLMGKPYLNWFTKRALSAFFSIYEKWACPKFDGIVAATPWIRDKYLAMGCNSVDVNNFPLLGELSPGNIDWAQKEEKV